MSRIHDMDTTEKGIYKRVITVCASDLYPDICPPQHSGASNALVPVRTPTDEEKRALRDNQLIDRETIRNRVKLQGGWTDRKGFDAANPPPKRKTHYINIANEKVSLEDLEVPAKIPKPDQSTLPRLSAESLRPPPSLIPETVSHINFTQSNTPVQTQSLQFLVMIRKAEDHQSWQFLDEASLKTVYDAAFNAIDDAELTSVAMGYFINQQKFSIITLSTANMPVFNQFRANIRAYRGVDGYILDTFSSMDYIEKTMLSIYIPKKFDNYIHRRLFRGLFRDYPSIAAPYRMHHCVVLESTLDRPTRGGDQIMVISGQHFLEKLSLFPENFCFHVNANWRITIKGGERHPEPITEAELARVARDADYSMEMTAKIGGNRG